MKLHKLFAQHVHVIESVGPTGVPGELHTLPSGEFCVDLLAELVRLLFQPADFFTNLDV